MSNKTTVEYGSRKFTIENLKDRVLITEDRNVFTIWKDRTFYRQLEQALESHLGFRVPTDFAQDAAWVDLTKTLINYYADRS